MDRYILEAQTGTKLPPKTIYLVRHGQSTHNAHAFAERGVDLNDACYIDAELTDLGVQQAKEIAPEIGTLNPELIVTSPMRRAIQTCLYATSDLPKGIPIAVNQHCRERLAYSCDIGSPASALEQLFPLLDFGSLEPKEAWWWTKEGKPGSVENSLQLLQKYSPGAYKDVESKANVIDRVNKFRTWLLKRPETRIIIFAHGVFLTQFQGPGSPHFRNTEIRKVTI